MGTKNPSSWVQETKLQVIKEAIFEVREEIERGQFKIKQNSSQDMVSNLILGGMLLASIIGGGIYASKHYGIEKLRRNTEKFERRRSTPLGHYAA